MTKWPCHPSFARAVQADPVDREVRVDREAVLGAVEIGLLVLREVALAAPGVLVANAARAALRPSP